MYHERMFYFWYGRNNMMRDYHGKKYHQLQSLPVCFNVSGIRFRNYKQDAVIALQSVAIVATFVVAMLACVAQFG
jgi:hypothetical protein